MKQEILSSFRETLNKTLELSEQYKSRERKHQDECNSFLVSRLTEILAYLVVDNTKQFFVGEELTLQFQKMLFVTDKNNSSIYYDVSAKDCTYTRKEIEYLLETVFELTFSRAIIFKDLNIKLVRVYKIPDMKELLT